MATRKPRTKVGKKIADAKEVADIYRVVKTLFQLVGEARARKTDDLEWNVQAVMDGLNQARAGLRGEG